MTVAEMLARISSRELTEWMIYYKMVASELSQSKTTEQPKAQTAEQQKFLLSGLLGFEE